MLFDDILLFVSVEFVIFKFDFVLVLLRRTCRLYTLSKIQINHRVFYCSVTWHLIVSLAAVVNDMRFGSMILVLLAHIWCRLSLFLRQSCVCVPHKYKIKKLQCIQLCLSNNSAKPFKISGSDMRSDCRIKCIIVSQES